MILRQIFMQCRARGRNKAICCFQACPPQTYVFGGRAVQGSAFAPASSLRYALLRWPLRALTIPHVRSLHLLCRFRSLPSFCKAKTRNKSQGLHIPHVSYSSANSIWMSNGSSAAIFSFTSPAGTQPKAL